MNPNIIDLTESQRADFYRGFMAALLWSEVNDEGGREGGFVDDEHTQNDMHPSLRDALHQQCAAFGRENASDLIEATNRPGYTFEQAGHDFALSRNGHGAGFFDRGLDEVGDRLQEAAGKAGEIDLYVGDDGLIYGSGLEPENEQAPAGRKPGP